MLFIGPKARILGFSAPLVLGLGVLNGFSTKNNFDFILSHGIDGIHSRASIHYNGNAADVCYASPVSAQDKLKFWKDLQRSLGQDFDVLFESIGTDNEHLHIEFQPKETY
jgi:hypothetical protein